MKVAIITLPMRPPHEVGELIYPVDGNKSIEYEKPVRCPISGVLAKTLKNGEQIKIIYISTTSENSESEKNKTAFIKEIEDINAEIGAVLSYDTVEMEFKAVKQTYNRLITDLADKIPDNSEIYADITYGFKPEVLSLFCALRFVEEFRESDVEYIIYGKAEFNKKTRQPECPMIFDITSLYYLFKLMGTMGASDPETASKVLKDFFAM